MILPVILCIAAAANLRVILKRCLLWMPVLIDSFLHYSFQLSALHLVDSAFDEGEQACLCYTAVFELMLVWLRVSTVTCFLRL